MLSFSGNKIVLKNVNGEFRSAELTGVIGPSGSGKTSLLNILSGFVNKNVFGSIRLNGEERHDEVFRKNSTYIMQEENLHSLLTVRESMNFAVKLKTGNVFTRRQREEKIFSVLKTLGLSEKLNDFAGHLSGGERKRLSIALELVDDPSILFLDEPTTGLDSSSSTQCILLLKKLALEGKTIVCTIHSPSALLLEMFDHLYALADGSCIYQGSSGNLVPFLSELDLICPEIYNPSDFLLEIATNAYGSQNDRLIKKIGNGSNEMYRSSVINNNNNNNDDATCKSDRQVSNDIRPLYSSSFALQFGQLMLRNFLFIKRDKMLLTIRLMVHMLVGLMIGFLYYDIGEDASQIFNIYRFIPISIGFLAYAGFYSLMVRCKSSRCIIFASNCFNVKLVLVPLDLPIVKREHFNRWYSTGAYYLSLLISDIPVIVTCSGLFISLICVMTNQPLENFRLLNMILIGILTSSTAQSYGLLVGSACVDVKVTNVGSNRNSL